jgi:hypothetical protein
MRAAWSSIIEPIGQPTSARGGGVPVQRLDYSRLRRYVAVTMSSAVLSCLPTGAANAASSSRSSCIRTEQGRQIRGDAVAFQAVVAGHVGSCWAGLGVAVLLVALPATPPVRAQTGSPPQDLTVAELRQVTEIMMGIERQRSLFGLPPLGGGEAAQLELMETSFWDEVWPALPIPARPGVPIPSLEEVLRPWLGVFEQQPDLDGPEPVIKMDIIWRLDFGGA